MTTLLGLNPYQSEALVVCLVASVLWAGALLLGAAHLERSGAARGDRLWIGALLLAVLPSLVAPSLAAFGVSLRPSGAATAIVDVQESQSVGAATARTGALDIEGAAALQPSPSPDGDGAIGPAMTAEQAVSALSLLYIYGVFLALFIWIARQAGFFAAAALAEPVRDEGLLKAVDDWAFDFGLKPPALKRSRHVSSVCVYGSVAPVILMPHDLDERIAKDDIALMCAHEIAHLKRGDTRLFTATALARVLFWFNPLVTRIAANVEMAAEEGADRLVIGSGIDRRAYASCFVNGLKYAAMKQSILPALAPGFTPNDRQGRRRRLDQILSADGERNTPFGARAALAGAASVAALLAVGQAALAVDPEAAALRKSELLAAIADTPENLAPLAAKAASARAQEFAKPVDGEVTLPFGKTYKSLEDNRTPVEHKGVDIKAPKGAPVKASRDGVVVEASKRVPGKDSYGTLVVIDHGHGLVSRYAHLDSYAVAIGQTVRKGDVIGAVGETGLVTGPHLHFEVLKNGEPVDPALAAAPEPPDAPDAPDAPQWTDAADAVLPAAPAEPVDPVIAFADDFSDPAVHFVFKGRDGFAFGNGDTLTDRMAADLEQRLLGDIESAEGAVYDISFTFDGKTHRFTSDEPMTAEKRAELKAVIDEMRIHRDRARKEWAKTRKEWDKQAGKMRLEAEKLAAKMKQEFAGDQRFAFRWEEDAQAARREFEDVRREAEEARREAIEAERAARRESIDAEREAFEAEIDALAAARADLDDALNDGIDEALADIDAEEAALDGEEVADEERRVMREALAEARRSVERSRRDHEIEIERVRRDLERREAEIQRELDRLDARMNEGN
jgi:murein DD-endopeptidase MepM/ murein hydrolase activator NlpD